MAKKTRDFGNAISWERVRAIFGDADPPAQIWEKQFDYNDDELKRLASTPYREIDRSDLWYYYHNLAYVKLQPELFAYLFPVCLMEWHDTLMRNEPCSRGDSEFHYGILMGRIFEKMLTPQQQDEVIEFFRDSFLQRLDAEPTVVQPSIRADPFGWICRFNSLGIIIDRIESIWEPWWKMETRGRAFAVLEYCSGLIYLAGDRQPFGIEVKNRGWFGPDLLESDSFKIHDRGWVESNLDFLRTVLSYDYVLKKIEEAAVRLASGPGRELARTILADAVKNRELAESRIGELPLLLSGKGPEDEWSV